MSASVVLGSLPVVNVATPGTGVALSTTAIDKVVAVYISALAANTGAVMVRGQASNASGLGVELVKNTHPLEISHNGHYIDLQNIFIDALNASDKASVTYLRIA